MSINKSLASARKVVRNTNMTMLKRWYDGCTLVYSYGNGAYFCDESKIRGEMGFIDDGEDWRIEKLSAETPKRHWLLKKQYKLLFEWMKEDRVPIYTCDGSFLVGDKWYNFTSPTIEEVERIFLEKRDKYALGTSDFAVYELAACYQNIEDRGIVTGKGIWRDEMKNI